MKTQDGGLDRLHDRCGEFVLFFFVVVAQRLDTRMISVDGLRNAWATRSCARNKVREQIRKSISEVCFCLVVHACLWTFRKDPS